MMFHFTYDNQAHTTELLFPNALNLLRAKLSYVRVHYYNFFFVSWSGVRLSPLGRSATVCPIVPAPDDR
jgi:hypothetical protein